MDTATKPDQHNISIAEIIKYSHAMVKLAEAGEWETVVEEDVTRRQLIKEFFSRSSVLASDPDIGNSIQQLLQLNEKLEKLSVTAREEARSAIDSIKTGRTAVNAYMKNAV